MKQRRNCVLVLTDLTLRHSVFLRVDESIEKALFPSVVLTLCTKRKTAKHDRIWIGFLIEE